MSRRLHQVVLDAIKLHPKKKPLNEHGQLVPDPVPMAPPVGFKPQPSLSEMIRAQVLAASRDAAREGFETVEEADDFDVGDDPEISSPYEIDTESEVPISVLRARAEAAQAEYMDAKRDAGLRMQDDGKSAPAAPQTPSEASPKPTGTPPEGGPGR